MSALGPEKCTECGHTHTGPAFGGICIGCPCPHINVGPAVEPECPNGDCLNKLLVGFAAMGIYVTARTEPPLVAGPYTTDPFICPHGVQYWTEPTGEQIAQWAADGVR